LSTLLELVASRSGHFRLESGHHGELWLDLDSLFADFRRVEPFVAQLVESIRPYDVETVCGPLLGGAFLAQLVAQALGVEFCFKAEGRRRKAEVVALLPSALCPSAFFALQRIPVEAVARKDNALWSPGDCPLCTAGVPLAER